MVNYKWRAPVSESCDRLWSRQIHTPRGTRDERTTSFCPDYLIRGSDYAAWPQARPRTPSPKPSKDKVRGHIDECGDGGHEKEQIDCRRQGRLGMIGQAVGRVDVFL